MQTKKSYWRLYINIYSVVCYDGKKGGAKMAKHPKLESLESLFNSGKSFELTDTEYEKKTGAPLPKRPYYLVTQSSLAKKAKEKGYLLELVEKRVILTKIGE